MRTRFFFRLALALGAGLPILGGCSAVCPPPPTTARDYGLSHRLAIVGQTLDPAAVDNREPVVGIDGKVALGIHNRYRAGFGYSKDLDSSVFDIRPTQPTVSEVTYKDVSGGRGQSAVPNIPIGVAR